MLSDYDGEDHPEDFDYFLDKEVPDAEDWGIEEICYGLDYLRFIAELEFMGII